MRKNIFAITLAGIMTFSGASAVMAISAPVPVQTLKAVSQTEALSETEEIPKSGNLSETETEAYGLFDADIVDDTTILTPYYSITLPKSWADSFKAKTVSNTTGMWLELFLDDERNTMAGNLFDLCLVEDDSYKIIADHELIGDLEDQQGNRYHVVVSYPTDIQCSREIKDVYKEMCSDIETILDTLTPAEGFEYIKAE